MDSSIGSKIKASRLSKKMSQNELCSDFINRVILSRIENSKMLPSIAQIMYIAERLGKSPNYFLSGENFINHIEINNSSQTSSALGEMFDKKMYYNIVKLDDEVYEKQKDIDDFNYDFYVGMSYFNLDVPYQAIKPLRKYENAFLKSPPHIQKAYIINFLNTLNTLFKIMLKSKNYTKCESYLVMGNKYIDMYGTDNSPIAFMINNNLAYLYLKQCRYNEVIGLLDTFLDAHKDFQYIFAAAYMHLSLNIAYYNLGRYEEAIGHIKKAISLYLYLDKPIDAGESYFNYINALR